MTQDRVSSETETLLAQLDEQLSGPDSRGAPQRDREDPLAELARMIGERPRDPASETDTAASEMPTETGQEPAAAPTSVAPRDEGPTTGPVEFDDDLATELEASLRAMDFASERDPFDRPDAGAASDIVPGEGADAPPEATGEGVSPQSLDAQTAEQPHQFDLEDATSRQDDDPFASLEAALSGAATQPPPASDIDPGVGADEASGEQLYAAAASTEQTREELYAAAAAGQLATEQPVSARSVIDEPGVQYEDGAPVFAEDEGDEGSPYDDDDDYDYDESSGSRRGMFVVAAVVGLMVVGGAAAYGYRAFVAEEGDMPVVRADADPAKTVPEQTGEASDEPGKIVYDRIGGNGEDPANGGQIVPREEAVTITSDGRPIRVITGEGAPTPAPVGEEGAPGEDDARRVRTLVVTPDGQIEQPVAPPVPEAPAPDVAVQTPGQPAPGEPAPVQLVPGQPAPDAGTPEVAVQVGQQPAAPQPLTPGATPGDVTPPQQAPASEQVAVAPPQGQPDSQLDAVRRNAEQQAEAQGVPLPLSRPARPQQPVAGQPTPVVVAPEQIPQAPAVLPPAGSQSNPVRFRSGTDDAATITYDTPQPAQRPVAVAPQPQPAQPQQQSQPQQVAAAPAPAQVIETGGGRGFVIQVASSPSESGARTALGNVQGRANNLIGNYRPVVQRADLGTRGIFYRAAFGPISNRTEALAVCNQLKRRGIDCFVRTQ